jgi:hypothetical protein
MRKAKLAAPTYAEAEAPTFGACGSSTGLNVLPLNAAPLLARRKAC